MVASARGCTTIDSTTVLPIDVFVTAKSLGVLLRGERTWRRPVAPVQSAAIGIIAAPTLATSVGVFGLFRSNATEGAERQCDELKCRMPLAKKDLITHQGKEHSTASLLSTARSLWSEDRRQRWFMN
jgi:hypothetical protein